MDCCHHALAGFGHWDAGEPPGADLRDADLSNADLGGANLIWHSASLISETRFPSS